jgi:hypothetical protein
MKKAIKIVLRTVFFITFAITVTTLAAQPMPPEPGGDPSGGGNGPVGGYAPIGSGLIILLALGAGYGSKKVYDARKKLEE